MKKFRTIAFSTVAVAIAYFVVAGKLEVARIGLPLAAAATPAGPEIDAAAMLDDVRTLSSAPFAGRRTGSDGNKMAQAYLVKRFEQLGIKPFGASYAMPFSFTHKSIKGLVVPGKPYITEYPSATNLVGYIPGKEGARVIVVSAHYDHLGVRDGVTYPGADDNASGVAAMLQIASWFSKHPPRHTIVFAAFDAEELGLRGAQAFVAALPFAREKLSMNLNLDMVSRNDDNEIWAAGVNHTPALRDIVSSAASRSALKVKVGHDRPMLVAGSVEDWTSSSDHGPFHDAGVPFLYFGVEDHDDYHKPGDTFDKIKPAFFSQVGSLLVDVAATADQKLDAVK
jgi:Zn-dependent M28 family amino/carboxypeptidase